MSVYLDKHTTDQSTANLSVQGGLNNSVSLSEFEKGLKEFRMEALHANSPQARSRIKWLFRTLQDRLVKAIRLREIRTIEKGNRFLEGFLPLYNKREDTELWTEMRKSIVAQMVRSFFDGGYLYTLKPIKECVDRRQDNLYA